MLGVGFIRVNGDGPFGHGSCKFPIRRAVALCQQSTPAADKPAYPEAQGLIGERKALGRGDGGNGKVHVVSSLFCGPSQKALTRAE